MHLISLRSILFLAAVGGLAALLLRGAPRAGRLDGMGVNLSADLSTSTAELEIALPQMEAQGVHWVREGIPWQQVEPTPGQFRFAWSDGVNTFDLDRTVGALDAAGIEMVAVLRGGPVYLAHAYPGQPVNTSALLEQWAAYVQAVVGRYGSLVDHWQIGEEPNSRAGWGEVIFPTGQDAQANPDPALYAQMLEIAAEIIRGTDPGDDILLGGLALDGSSDCAVDAIAFLGQLAERDAWDHFDILTVNSHWAPYAPESTQTRGRPHDPQTGACLADGWVETTLEGEIGALQSFASQFGERPLWITSLGWDENSLQAQGNLRGMVSALVESDFTARSYAQLLAVPGFQRVFWNAQADESGALGYGLDPLGQQTFANLNDLLVGSQSLGQFQGQEGGNTHEYRYQRDHLLIVVLWSTAGGESIAARVDGLQGRTVRGYTADATSLSHSGGQILPVADDGSLALWINERPVILIAETSNVLQAGRDIIEDRIAAWKDGVAALGQDWLRMQQRGVEMALSAWMDNLVESTLQSLEGWVRNIFSAGS